MRKDSLVLTAGPTVLALVAMIFTVVAYFEVFGAAKIYEQALVALTICVTLAYVVQAHVQRRWSAPLLAVLWAASALVNLDRYLELYLLKSLVQSL